MSLVRLWSAVARNRALWAAVTIALGAVLYLAATSTDVYELTSPSYLTLHVLLRKAYSVAAFALLGFALQLAVARPRYAALRNAAVIAAYSALIEVGQYAGGVREGLPSNAVDLLCGAVGGWIGTAVAGRLRAHAE